MNRIEQRRDTLLQGLGVSQIIRTIAAGKGPEPWESEQPVIRPADNIPPAFVPLWEHGASLELGLWIPWFLDRAPTFVEMSFENGRRVQEFARNEKQAFLYELILEYDTSEELHSEWTPLAEELGILHLERLESNPLPVGGDPSGMILFEEFQTVTPLSIADRPELYDGAFFNSHSKDESQWASACWFEVDYETCSDWPPSRAKPPWFSSRSKPELFQKYMETMHLKEAWLTLNSPGWKSAEAIRALETLLPHSKNPSFRLYVDYYREISRDLDAY